MKPTHITDDLNRLLGLLPEPIKESLTTKHLCDELIEVVLDLGRVPEARFPEKVVPIGEECVTRRDIQTMVKKLGEFGEDNRAGIERTLHRISAIRNRKQEVVGLTCRVGRAVFGTVEMVRDLLDSEQSLLLMGRPGVGKTTALREIARVLADDLKKRVVIIDTSNEIAGDGDIPHPSIGSARRMQVAKPEHQHQVMIEAVENHMPEVIVIDEIGTELEAHAARTIAERGVQLVATAHGNALANLIKNPTLSDLVGGIESVTLGDEEARRRRTQKTVLERAAEPTFPIAVEINSRNYWSIHSDVASTVDLLLRGQKANPQNRELDSNGLVRLLNEQTKQPQPLLKRPAKYQSIPDPALTKQQMDGELMNTKIATQQSLNQTAAHKQLQVLCCEISTQVVDEAIRLHSWPARWVENLNEADVVLTIRQGLSKQTELRNQARKALIPILVIKSGSFAQIERALKRLLSRYANIHDPTSVSREKKFDKEDDLSALEECRLAVEKVVIPLGRPVELLPRSTRVIKMQSELINRYQLRSDVFRHAEDQHLRVYPP